MFLWVSLQLSVLRFRGFLPPRWLREHLLIHQSLVFFCSSLQPLRPSLVLPLKNLRAELAPRRTGPAYRVVISGAAEESKRLPQRRVVLAVSSEKEAAELVRRIEEMAAPWR